MSFDGPSRNGRFLWIAIAVYVGFIYLTLPLMRSVVEFLYAQVGREQLSLYVNLSILVALGLLLLYLRQILPRASKKQILLGFFLLLAGSLILLLFAPEERIHLFEYGLLGFFCLKALGRETPMAHVKAMMIVLFVGIGDELIQHALPSRVGDPRDVALNLLSGVPGVLVQHLRWEGERPS
ncbi:MAG: VanZ family protein [bacterium]|nr:VanZ family protein [bacterium]